MVSIAKCIKNWLANSLVTPAALAGAGALLAGATFAGGARAEGFCPERYGLIAGLCIAKTTGDVVRPTTPIRTANMTAEAATRMCAAWDVHVTTHIEDFGNFRIWPSSWLAEAFGKQIQARKLCGEGQHEAGLKLYEAILGDNDAE